MYTALTKISYINSHLVCLKRDFSLNEWGVYGMLDIIIQYTVLYVCTAQRDTILWNLGQDSASYVKKYMYFSTVSAHSTNY